LNDEESLIFENPIESIAVEEVNVTLKQLSPLLIEIKFE